ncbi:MAG: ATP-binding protein [Candidatus Korobacteraceae bacterium]|jgi:two-component system sensor histidine kinase CpxA
MKSRLFWKIFLPFWILQTIIMLFLAYRVHASFGPDRPWWVQPERRAIPVLARSATWRYSNRGQQGLRELLQDIDLDNRSVYWLFDAKLNELSGFPMPAEARDTIQRALQNEGIANSRSGTFIVQRATNDKGQNFVFAGEFFFPPLLHTLPVSVLFVILFTSLLTSLLCAVLAQYITRPILRLRDAAHAIAQGNLEARAGLSGSTRRDEIADLVQDFDTMAGEIHDLVESNKRMLMGASHDLRSPISRIRVALSLASTAPEPERNELLGRIEFELLRLNGMIEQILTVARLESGQFKPAAEPLSLNQVIGEAVEDARFEASQSNVEIVYDENWPEVTMAGEENMLRSAFENVLRNAIFYSGVNGCVQLSVELDGSAARVSVRDDGPGVPEAALPKLFDPFYRVDDARGTATGGSGLGLSIVSGAVKFHNGSVSARNLHPRGLEIMIMLPIAAVPAPIDCRVR